MVPDTTPPTVSVALPDPRPGATTTAATSRSPWSPATPAPGWLRPPTALDGGPSPPYTAAFAVAAAGSHTVVATAIDQAGNTASATGRSPSRRRPRPTSPSSRPTSCWAWAAGSCSAPSTRASGRPHADRAPTTAPVPLQVDRAHLQRRPGRRLQAGRRASPASFTVAPGAHAAVAVEFRPTATRGAGHDPHRRQQRRRHPTWSGHPAGPGRQGLRGQPRAAALPGPRRPSATRPRPDRFTLRLSDLKTPVGDEVISPYWNRVDTTSPVQLDARWPATSAHGPRRPAPPAGTPRARPPATSS